MSNQRRFCTLKWQNSVSPVSRLWCRIAFLKHLYDYVVVPGQSILPIPCRPHFVFFGERRSANIHVVHWLWSFDYWSGACALCFQQGEAITSRREDNLPHHLFKHSPCFSKFLLWKAFQPTGGLNHFARGNISEKKNVVGNVKIFKKISLTRKTEYFNVFFLISGLFGSFETVFCCFFWLPVPMHTSPLHTTALENQERWTSDRSDCFHLKN